MNSLSKSFIIFYLMACILAVFVFHWFFIYNMMPVSECFSTDCVYSLDQAIPPQTANALLIALLSVFIVALLPFAIWLEDKLKKTPGWMFLKWNIDTFFYKLISWLKILEKRDPEVELIAARV